MLDPERFVLLTIRGTRPDSDPDSGKAYLRASEMSKGVLISRKVQEVGE